MRQTPCYKFGPQDQKNNAISPRTDIDANEQYLSHFVVSETRCLRPNLQFQVMSVLLRNLFIRVTPQVKFQKSLNSSTEKYTQVLQKCQNVGRSSGLKIWEHYTCKSSLLNQFQKYTCKSSQLNQFSLGLNELTSLAPFLTCGCQLLS